MKASELNNMLIAEGCNKSNFAILSQGNDAFCLNKKGKEWAVFYSERGCDSEPIFSSKSENAACEFFFNYVKKQEHWHIVGIYKNENEAKELEDKIATIGVKSIRNDIPDYQTTNGLRFRVFVVGKDIFKVRERLGSIQIKYA